MKIPLRVNKSEGQEWPEQTIWTFPEKAKQLGEGRMGGKWAVEDHFNKIPPNQAPKYMSYFKRLNGKSEGKNSSHKCLRSAIKRGFSVNKSYHYPMKSKEESTMSLNPQLFFMPSFCLRPLLLSWDCVDSLHLQNDASELLCATSKQTVAISRRRLLRSQQINQAPFAESLGPGRWLEWSLHL